MWTTRIGRERASFFSKGSMVKTWSKGKDLAMEGNKDGKENRPPGTRRDFTFSPDRVGIGQEKNDWFRKRGETCEVRGIPKVSMAVLRNEGRSWRDMVAEEGSKEVEHFEEKKDISWKIMQEKIGGMEEVEEGEQEVISRIGY
ncbi:hypothetical protein R1flu_018477 [Riccia fluitans]|uniref:Uncharacterized protein n=1 Tax=Riccia fluitans TaxID=41844 RepID=A0ABD1ZJE8_9MARC